MERLFALTALVAAGFLYFLLKGIDAIFGDREVYRCTMCSGGARWSGRTWVHANGRLEAPNEGLPGMTHPAIPARTDDGSYDQR